ncbi:jg7131 [Pararge aegeria aegeria]|uniref:Jg7131 protein n=1 Tax=Pararge aegeria aegeria TaxID=348720 RepID=A0A8S4S6B8_9NEOP|nr:jg7131 [Pararge aegeria aegeria]
MILMTIHGPYPAYDLRDGDKPAYPIATNTLASDTHALLLASIHICARSLGRPRLRVAQFALRMPDMAVEVVALTLKVVTAVVVLCSGKDLRVLVATTLSFRALDSTGVFKLKK